MGRDFLHSKGMSLVLGAGLGLALMGGPMGAPAVAWCPSTAFASQTVYADGTYQGSGKGIGGDVPVTVVVKNGAIADVEIGENSETTGIGSNAIQELPAAIIEANGTDGIDCVTGATVTSKAILSAVESALAGAADEGADVLPKALKQDDVTASETTSYYSVDINDGDASGKLTVTLTPDGLISSVDFSTVTGGIAQGTFESAFKDCVAQGMKNVSVEPSEDESAEKQSDSSVQTIGVLDLEWLLGQQPLSVAGAEYCVQDDRYKALYPDMLQAFIINNGSDDIRDAVVAFVAWDANGLPVKIEGKYDFSGGQYVALCSFDAVNLIPGATYGYDSGMPLDSDTNNIASFKAVVVSYTLFDGTEWNNPYYEAWRTMYEGAKYSDELTVETVVY